MVGPNSSAEGFGAEPAWVRVLRLECGWRVAGVWLAGQGSNLRPPDPKSGVLPIELPATDGTCDRTGTFGIRPAVQPPLALATAMGSLIKKRRKRMRKKKHKKMLKATRWQRRAGK